MSVKFIEYWNLLPQKEKEYATYLTEEWIPGMNELGITILAVWNILVGTGPQFVCEGIAEDLQQIQEALRDERHAQLNEGLFDYVDQYFSRVLTPTGLLPTLIGEPHHRAVKLNQFWDPRPGMEAGLRAFLAEEFAPALEEMGLVVGGHWRTLVGPPPRQKLEGRAGSLEEVSAVLHNTTFYELKGRLMDQVNHYDSQILNLKVVRVIGRAAVTYEYL